MNETFSGVMALGLKMCVEIRPFKLLVASAVFLGVTQVWTMSLALG